ncbi:unnamed protein product (mitochondrion) [Plasmodiophora brassicae]|uniref:Ubiquitin-like protease family profile domain-containing protein n=1 Tax=Plasmodiophora brassicae TaxID=37360 RepID=A0A3P3Y8R7_PLABS|nr:unnamed protein product [Plasmodiophora brassicae]
MASIDLVEIEMASIDLPCFLDVAGLPAQADFAALMPLDDLLFADSLIECPPVVDPLVDREWDRMSTELGTGEDRDPGIMFPGCCDAALSYKLVVIMTRLHEAVMMRPRVRQVLDWLLTFEGREKRRRQPAIPLDGLDAEGMAQFVLYELRSPMSVSDVSKVIKLSFHDLIFHLAHRSWLNSSVVHEAMTLISKDSTHVAPCKVEMNDHGRWGVIAECDSSATMFLCPVNFFNVHWCLVVVDAALGLVYLYDSLCDPTYTARLRSIATNAIMPWATSAFPAKPFETRVLAGPRQLDDCNCGMLVLTMAEALARSLPVTFKSSCMDVMRLRWMYWCLHADFYLDNK